MPCVTSDRAMMIEKPNMESYDALLVVSFGGPEGPDDVMPFLENVTRGKNVPRERLLEVAEHYYHFGGVSPINQQNRELIAALQLELSLHGPRLPVYWGNRNWHPLLSDTIRQMRSDGIRRAAALVTSAFSSYSGCRQYRENIEHARQLVGVDAPVVDKLRVFFNHPGFIEAQVDRIRSVLSEIPRDRLATTQIIFTAHSIPIAMANGCRYVAQLMDAAEVIASMIGSYRWKLAYQSRSGPPSQPWLEPDISDWLRELAETKSCTDVIVVPIGFVSDHIEILFDLDEEARQTANQLGFGYHLVKTVGAHPRFVRMIRELLCERLEGLSPIAWGALGPNPHVCLPDCCLSGRPATGGPPAAT